MKKILFRGDVYYADLNPVIGSEQGGKRPVVIIQNDLGNRYSPTVIVAAVTGRKKIKLPTHVALKGIPELDHDSIILLEQLRTIDKQRLREPIGSLDKLTMKELDQALLVSIGIKKKADTPLILCLCPTCASQFYDNPDYSIRRLDPEQEEKDACMYCSVRQGFD
ncbi:type II toxin-antitoxin system PemK/MazF family toxin, partial [Anaerovorax odorimutans]